MDIVYQANAQDYTPLQAANGFALSWFDKPREIENFNATELTFNLANGCAIYKIIHIEGVRLVSLPLWQIVRLSNA